MPFLLERLAARPTALDGRQEAFDETAAIQAQIQRLLATRTLHDSGPAALVRWGLPNPVEIGQRDMPAQQRYAELVRRAITQHEPRLKDVSVLAEPMPDTQSAARLVITAALVRSGEPVLFDLRLPH